MEKKKTKQLEKSQHGRHVWRVLTMVKIYPNFAFQKVSQRSCKHFFSFGMCACSCGCTCVCCCLCCVLCAHACMEARDQLGCHSSSTIYNWPPSFCVCVSMFPPVCVWLLCVCVCPLPLRVCVPMHVCVCMHACMHVCFKLESFTDQELIK